MNKVAVMLVLAALVAVDAMAQDAVVRSFEATPTDLSARTYPRLDRHGMMCALLKVRVIASGVSFAGNVMGEPEKRGSQYWVYVTAGTKMLEISADTFLSFMYNFPEPLESGVTYVLTIDAPQPAPPCRRSRQRTFWC